MKGKKILNKLAVLLLTITMIIPSNLQMVFAKQQNKNLIKLQTKTITLDKGAKKQIKVITPSKCKITKIKIIKNSNKKAASAKTSNYKIYLTGNKKGKSAITIRVKYIYKKKTKTEKLQLQVNVKEKSKVKSTIKLSTGNLILNEKETKQVKIIIPSKEYKIKSVTVKNNNKKIANIKASKSKFDITGLKEGITAANIVIKYEYKKKTKTKELKLQIKVTKKAQKITIHTVSFESNGGSPVAIVKIADGEILEKPITDPQKEGYTFDGWYSDTNLNTLYDFSQKVYKDMTLYAKWKESKEPKIYTRSEWIKILIDSLDINKEEIKNNDKEEEDVDYECADIDEDVNSNEIQEAYSLGIIPDEREDKEQDVIFFEPTKIVTREYMAYTLSKALGFQDMKEHAQIQDIDESAYPDEIYNVVRAKAMTVDNDKFYPTNVVKEEDIELAKKEIAYWVNSDKEEIKEHDDSKLQEDVKDFRDFDDYEVTNNDDIYNIKLNAKLPDNKSLKVGDKIIMGKNDQDSITTFYITKIINDNEYECRKPDISEIFSKIDVATKHMYTDYKKIKVSEGVKLDHETSTLRKSRIGGGVSLGGLKLKIDFGEGKKISDKIKIAGKTEFSIPEIIASFDADIAWGKIKINEYKFKMKEEISADTGLYLTDNKNCAIPTNDSDKAYKNFVKNRVGNSGKVERFEIAKIPLVNGILSGSMKLFVEVYVTGEIAIKAELESEHGIIYQNGVLRNIGNGNKAKFSAGFYGKAYLDVLGVAFDIDICNTWSAIGITFQGGACAEGSLVERLNTFNPLICGEAELYPEFKVTLDRESAVGKWLAENKGIKVTYSHSLIGEDKIKKFTAKFHTENFHKVDECTYGQGNIDGYVLYAKNGSPVEKAQVEVYTKGSQDEEIPIRTVYTDSLGYYKIKNLSIGNYDVKIKVSGCNQTILKDIGVEKDKTYTIKTIKVGERVKTNKVNSIALGENNSAAIREDGSLWMWGNNSCKQISDENKEYSILQPQKIMKNVKSVSLGSVNSAAIKKDGSLWLWGTNTLDEILKLPPNKSYKPYKIMDDVKSVSLGGSTGAAIKKDGTLWMWGTNTYGQIGDGTQNECKAPKKIMDNVKSVSVGIKCTAAIKEDGSLWMWGFNSNGQLGDGTTENSLIPKKIMNNVKAVSVNATNYLAGHTAILKEDGTLWTCGWNGYGQLGDGTINESHKPKQIKIIDEKDMDSLGEDEDVKPVKIVSIAVGGDNTAAIGENGSLWMWGSNYYYKQLKSDQSHSYSQTKPQKIAENGNIKEVKLSKGFSAYVNSGGILWCMGQNYEGQLGDGTTADSDSMKEVTFSK